MRKNVDESYSLYKIMKKHYLIIFLIFFGKILWMKIVYDNNRQKENDVFFESELKDYRSKILGIESILLNRKNHHVMEEPNIIEELEFLRNEYKIQCLEAITKYEKKNPKNNLILSEAKVKYCFE